MFIVFCLFFSSEIVVEEKKMAGKGGKGLVAGKTMAAAAANKEKDKKRPVSRSARAGLQV